jgi:hypothetical protein
MNNEEKNIKHFSRKYLQMELLQRPYPSPHFAWLYAGSLIYLGSNPKHHLIESRAPRALILEALESGNEA